jgi:hypothetical protein
MGLLMSVVSSEELRSFLLRVYRALEHGDEAAVHEMVSSAPHALLVGTDPDEWVTGGDVVSIMATQTRELAGVTIKPGEPTAYCDGNVGCGVAFRVRPSRGRAEIPLRRFVGRDGSWVWD